MLLYSFLCVSLNCVYREGNDVCCLEILWSTHCSPFLPIIVWRHVMFTSGKPECMSLLGSGLDMNGMGWRLAQKEGSGMQKLISHTQLLANPHIVMVSTPSSNHCSLLSNVTSSTL